MNQHGEFQQEDYGVRGEEEGEFHGGVTLKQNAPDIVLELKPRYYPVLSYLFMSVFISWLLVQIGMPPNALLATVVISLCGLYFLISFILLAFIRPCRIRMDVQGDLFHAPIIGAWRRVQHKAIGFSHTPERYKERIGMYPGLIVYLSNGNVIELNGLATKGLDVLARYLRKLGIKSLGHESVGFPFWKLRYRFIHRPQ